MNGAGPETKMGYSLRSGSGKKEVPLVPNVPNRLKLPPWQLSSAARFYIDVFRTTLARLPNHVISQSSTHYGPNLEVKDSTYKYIGYDWEAELVKSPTTETLIIKKNGGSYSIRDHHFKRRHHFKVVGSDLRQQADNAPAIQLVGLELLRFQESQSKNYETALEEFRYRNPDLLKPPMRLLITEEVSNPQELAAAS